MLRILLIHGSKSIKKADPLVSFATQTIYQKSDNQAKHTRVSVLLVLVPFISSILKLTFNANIGI